MSKTYLVTNQSEGSICVTGRTRIDIPGLCKDLPLSLPDNTARKTILRLKQRYPLLKIREVQENQIGNNSKSNPDKTQTLQNTETGVEKGQVLSSVANSVSATSDDKTSTQKSNTKKGK